LCSLWVAQPFPDALSRRLSRLARWHPRFSGALPLLPAFANDSEPSTASHVAAALVLRFISTGRLSDPFSAPHCESCQRDARLIRLGPCWFSGAESPGPHCEPHGGPRPMTNVRESTKTEVCVTQFGVWEAELLSAGELEGGMRALLDAFLASLQALHFEVAHPRPDPPCLA
jgi:hypothetical protein